MNQKLSKNIVLGIILILMLFLHTHSAAKSRAEFMAYEAMRQDVKPEHALAMLDSISQYHSSEISERQELQLLKRQVELAMGIGRYDTAARALQKLKQRQNGCTFPDIMRMELNTGICNYYAGEYATAINSAFAVLSEDKPPEMKEFDIEAYLLLSNVATRINAPEESQRFLDLAKEKTNKLTADSLRRVCDYKILLGRSSRCLIQEDYQNAYHYLVQADSLGVHGVSPYCLQMNLALVYSQEHADDIAERYYREILNSPAIHYNRCVALNNYADFLMEHGRIDEALEVMDINGPELATVNATHAIGIRQLMRFQTLAAKKDYARAIESADSALNIMMDLMTQESRRMYSQIYGKFHSDKMSHELAEIKKENKSLYIVCTIFLLLMLGGGVWIYVAERKKKHLSAMVEKGQTDLALSRDEYIERIDQLQEDLDRKNRELTKLELKNTQMLSRFDSLASNPDLNMKGTSKIADVIKAELRALSRNGSDWSAFEVYFEQVHPDFYDKLSSLHPELTRGERRMCAFIRIGMKTSEIATLCNRSSRTIDSMKYRLKKKLDIPQGESLDNYLSTLGSAFGPRND